MLIDACYAGVGAMALPALAEDLSQDPSLRGADPRPTDPPTTAASPGPSPLAFATVSTMSLRLSPLRAVHRVIRDACPRQCLRHPTNDADLGLFLARNAARSRPAGPDRAGEEIARLTADFQPTPMGERAVAASGGHRAWPWSASPGRASRRWRRP